MHPGILLIAPAVKAVGPVDGLTVTSLSALVDPHRPVAVAVIVAIPLKAASQSIIPLTEFITPAVKGKN